MRTRGKAPGKPVHALRVAARALSTCLRRPLPIVLLALALSAARLLFALSAEPLLDASIQYALGASWLLPLALLVPVCLFALTPVVTIAGTTFGVVARGWRIHRVAAQLRHAPAFALSSTLTGLAVVGGVVAQLSALMAVARVGAAEELSSSALLLCSGVTFGAISLLSTSIGLLVLARIGQHDDETVGLRHTLLLVGQTTIELLGRPGRLIGLCNATLLVTMPFALLFWLGQAWQIGMPGGWLRLPLILGQQLCMAVTMLTWALALERDGAASGPISVSDGPAAGPVG